MKKLILFALVSLLIIPLAEAQLLCDEATYPFRACQVIQNFTSVAAGSPNIANVSFKYIGNEWAPLVVRVNISSEGYVFSGNDFSGTGRLLTKALIGPVQHEIPLTCELPPITFTQTGETFVSPLPNNFTLYCYNSSFYVVMPESLNNVTITLIPNIALIPAIFNFTIELMTDIGVPILEPTINITNGFGNLSINPPFEKIEFISYPEQNITIRVLIYDSIFFRGVPTNHPFPIIYFDFINQTPFNGSVGIRYYFDRDALVARGWDPSKLSFYRLNVVNGTASWIQMLSTVTDNYVFMNITSFSVYGVFTSFYYPPAPAVTYVSYPSYPTYVTNVTNVSQLIEKPVERIIERPAAAVCGNGYCESGETCSNCPEDCGCPAGTKCEANVCVAIPPAPAPSPLETLTGAFISAVSNPVFAGLLSLVIVAIILTILRIRLFSKIRTKK
ncbi:MAG: hypothetical protein QXQ18_01005 [Candidatus Aenigmatarchaeota archaeon]